jgi:predicted nuclease of restriction endonuclease-like (RecB) superfamily
MLLNPVVINDIKTIINTSREKAIRAVDTERVLMYWHIGQRIFLEEQEGKDRADYGKFLIKTLSEHLQPEFGSGYSIRQINLYRQFYRTFSIVHTVYAQLSWSHYKHLLSIDSQNSREFYIAETVKNNWSVRQLERQISSNLFERLLMSNDQDSVMAVANKEQHPTDAKQIIKDSMYLEFLGLKRESSYYEKDLESAIITHLQEFLLELGNGLHLLFAFIILCLDCPQLVV